jgi:hypothetical protein
MEKNEDRDKSTMDVRQQLSDPMSAGSRGLSDLARNKLSLEHPLRKHAKEPKDINPIQK